MSEAPYDLAIIGGGINGAGLARDAAGRGLKVVLVEMNDLGSGTSSWSTKLIHGGLRYLETGQFRLVREALVERETLWAIAPHIIEPARFVLPHQRGMRPAWLLRLGLFLYDHLGGRKALPGTRTLDIARHAAGAPLKKDLFGKAFEYSDCRVDDARLVLLNAMDARARGAEILTRTKALKATRTNGLWEITLDSHGARRVVRAKVLVNAAGPWVAAVLDEVAARPASAHVRLVQGSHIVVPRIAGGEHGYMFQNPDGRIIFVLPWLDRFTLIGTTDRAYDGAPGEVHASEAEIAYLCDSASAHLARPVRREQIVWSFSGLRPLHDDGTNDPKAVTRDYVLELDQDTALLSIFGGKITTYRKLAEAALDRIAPLLPSMPRQGWTAVEPLPGGDFPMLGRTALIDRLRGDYPFLHPHHAARLAAAYGTRAWTLLGQARGLADLGRHFGATLFEAEVRYAMEEEMARNAQDMLWRRTKLGLDLTPDEARALEDWMQARRRPVPA